MTSALAPTPTARTVCERRELGRKVLDSTKGRTASWQAAYHPGSVKVVAYDENGKVVATDEQDSFDDSAMVCLQADRKTISGDGRELAFITITTRDRTATCAQRERPRDGPRKWRGCAGGP